MGWITFSYIGGRKNESWMAAASKSQTHREEEEENSISEMKIPLFRDCVIVALHADHKTSILLHDTTAVVAWLAW